MNENSQTRTFLPKHDICKENVEVPTISLVNMGPPGEEKLTLCVQWFGETKKPLPPGACIPEGSQFLFSLTVKPDKTCFFGEPEKFYVVFLEQVKNWLKPETTQAMINDLGGSSNPDGWIIWLLNPQVAMDFGGYPASLAIRIAVLGDPNCGIISPKPYTNLAARDEAIKTHAAQFQDNN